MKNRSQTYYVVRGICRLLTLLIIASLTIGVIYFWMLAMWAFFG